LPDAVVRFATEQQMPGEASGWEVGSVDRCAIAPVLTPNKAWSMPAAVVADLSVFSV